MKALFLHLVTTEVRTDIFPVGYAAIVAYLQKKGGGHRSELIFPRAHRLSDEQIFSMVQQTDAGIIAMGGPFSNLPRAEALCLLCKKARPDLPIVIGGPLATYSAELALTKTKADFAVRGDGEIAMADLMTCLENYGDTSKIPGVAFIQDNQFVDNALAPRPNLDDIPLPDWNLFPFDYYTLSPNHSSRSMTWVFSRGCIGKCNFCSPGGPPRFKSVDALVEQLHEMRYKLKIDSITFADNIIGPTPKYISELCRRLFENNIIFNRIYVNLRANQVSVPLLQDLKLIGTKVIGLGMESANDRVLQAMNKKVTVEEIQTALGIIKSQNMTPVLSCMVGQPGETLEDFTNTLRMFLEATDFIQTTENAHDFGPLITFPGTKIYEYGKENGHFRDDFDFYDKFFNAKEDPFTKMTYPGWFNYTQYSDDIVTRFFNFGYRLSKWNFFRANQTQVQKTLMDTLYGLRREVCIQEGDDWPPLDMITFQHSAETLFSTDMVANKRVVLYGMAKITGLFINRIKSRQDITLTALSDSRSGFWNQVLQGIPIQQMETIPKDSYDVIILCAETKAEENALFKQVISAVGNDVPVIRNYTYMMARQDNSGLLLQDCRAKEVDELRRHLESIVRPMF